MLMMPRAPYANMPRNLPATIFLKSCVPMRNHDPIVRMMLAYGACARARTRTVLRQHHMHNGAPCLSHCHVHKPPTYNIPSNLAFQLRNHDPIVRMMLAYALYYANIIRTMAHPVSHIVMSINLPAIIFRKILRARRTPTSYTQLVCGMPASYAQWRACFSYFNVQLQYS